MQGRAKVCKGRWAPEWWRNGARTQGKVLEGLARGWWGRGGQWGHLCKGVQRRARAGGRKNCFKTEWGHQKDQGRPLDLSCKSVQGLVGA